MPNHVWILQKGADAELDQHLDQYEIDCSCTREDCQLTIISEELLRAFHSFREDVKTYLHINSGFRCQAHNADIGGKVKSRHLIGFALDIAFPIGIDHAEFYAKAQKYFDYVELHPSFIHCHKNPTEFKS